MKWETPQSRSSGKPQKVIFVFVMSLLSGTHLKKLNRFKKHVSFTFMVMKMNFQLSISVAYKFKPVIIVLSDCMVIIYLCILLCLSIIYFPILLFVLVK